MTRDTLLLNLHGNVVQMSQKDYTATKGNGDLAFTLGDPIESSDYTFDNQGMITHQKVMDANGNTLSETHRSYKDSPKETVMTTPEGTVTTTRDLEAGTMQQIYRDNNGQVTKTIQIKINKKALPLQATSTPSDTREAIDETLWERDVRGNVTAITQSTNGIIVSKKVYAINKMGDPTQEIETNATDTLAIRAYLYNYDQKGNWNRRITTQKKRGKEYQYTITERAFSYN